MKPIYSVRKSIINVDFICTNNSRLAHLLPHSDMDVIYSVRPLWDSVLSVSNIIFNGVCVYPPDTLVLRWFEINQNYQMDGILTLPVEISYGSRVLDRQDKLDRLGV